ncbi:MAG TPA: hypothetical protein VEF04_12855, partial [Blastocatellia bacterium]|nr:hypothetical protein [Blastocatellia bacterium]
MSKAYRAFEVYRLLAGGVKQFVSGASVTIKKASDNSTLATVTANANGFVAGGTIPSINQLDGIYYEYTESSVVYRGQQDCGELFGQRYYQDIVVAEDIHETFYKPGNIEPVAIEVWVIDDSVINPTWRLFGVYAPNAEVFFPTNPVTDKSPTF